MIEFRDLDYAFDVFSGAISLKEALAARVRHPWRDSKGVAITYLFDTVLRTFFWLAKCVPQITPQPQLAKRPRLAHLRSMCSPTPSELLRPIRTVVKENLYERF